MNKLKHNSKDKNGIKKAKNLFVVPVLILWLIFILYPFIYSFILMFQNCQGTQCSPGFITNVERLLSDSLLWKSLLNTIVILIIQLPIMIFIALLFAVLLKNGTKLNRIYKTIIYLPTVMGAVSFTVLFKVILSQNGTLNEILLKIGLIDQPIAWLIESRWAMIAVILILTWRWVGYSMIYYLSGLQSIPSEVYEAAEIDGSSKVNTFFKVTIPLLKPIIIFNLVTSTITTLQLFELPQLLTGGGPNNATMTISMHIYNKAFTGIPNMGYAAMISYLVVLMVGIFAIIQLKLMGDKNE